MYRVPFLPKLAVILVVFSALLANFNLLFSKSTALKLNLLGRDSMTLYESRYEQLKKILPRHGIVGYISNLKTDDIRFDPGFGQYYFTQYALAPLVVAQSSEQFLVIGNFQGSASVIPAVVTNMVLVKDFGNGIMLFRREGY